MYSSQALYSFVVLNSVLLMYLVSSFLVFLPVMESIAILIRNGVDIFEDTLIK